MEKKIGGKSEPGRRSDWYFETVSKISGNEYGRSGQISLEDAVLWNISIDSSTKERERQECYVYSLWKLLILRANLLLSKE